MINLRRMNIKTSVIRLLLPHSALTIQQSDKCVSMISRYARSIYKITLSKCHYASSANENTNIEKFANEFEVNETTHLFDELDIEAITANDPRKLQTLKVLLTKLDIMRNNGTKLPTKLKIEHWREIVTMPSISQQIKFLKFRHRSEIIREERKEIQLEKRKHLEEFRARRNSQPKEVLTTSSPLKYTLNHNTIFQRIRESTINQFYNYKLCDPMVYGPDIVFDFEYDTFMSRRELGSAVRQVMLAWCSNRDNLQPFNVVLSNLSKENKMYNKLKELFPLMDEHPTYPLNITSKSYLDLYPRDQLVYLSPHAVDTVKFYDPNKTYIIGVMVDIVMPEPLSLAKAKKYGIQTLKLPLNEYINWRSGGKALQMDQVLRIILDIKNGCDWKTTLMKHIPERKLAFEQPEKQKSENSILSARTIRKMYFKNKVHELIVDERPQKMNN